MRGYLLGSAIAALAIASAATAAQPVPPPGVAQGTGPATMAPSPPPGVPQMRVMIGGDHMMVRQEVAEHVGKLFAKLDANHDGFITRQEVEAIHARMEAAMQRVGDAQQRLAEHGDFMGDRGAMFDRLDTNHDGNISRQEFLASKPQMHEERVMIIRDGSDRAPGASDGGPMGGHPGMGMGMHMGHMGMSKKQMAECHKCCEEMMAKMHKGHAKHSGHKAH